MSIFIHPLVLFYLVDFASMELLHARLVRTTTCANGCKCDYTICGDHAHT